MFSGTGTNSLDILLLLELFNFGRENANEWSLSTSVGFFKNNPNRFDSCASVKLDIALTVANLNPLPFLCNANKYTLSEKVVANVDFFKGTANISEEPLVLISLLYFQV